MSAPRFFIGYRASQQRVSFHGEDLDQQEKLNSKRAAREAGVGAEKRIGLVAEDFVKH